MPQEGGHNGGQLCIVIFGYLITNYSLPCPVHVGEILGGIQAVVIYNDIFVIKCLSPSWFCSASLFSILFFPMSYLKFLE